MARQSVRIQAKLAAAEDPQMQDATASSTVNSHTHARDDEYKEYEEEEPEKHARKRARKSTRSISDSKRRIPEQFRKVRGKLGMLERLAKDVPLDVIFEIFFYLDPSDLLRLARTSKDLRCILMSKTSENIWRTARGNVQGLPPLPFDLNEPQYAHLLYESYCHVCNHKGRCDFIYWSFRMRCCKNCSATFPGIFDSEYCYNQPADFRGCNILPKDCTQGAGTRRHVGNLEIAERFKAEYEALQTPEDRSAWLVRKSEERRTLDAHGRLCEDWHRARLANRTGELSNIREQRKDAILDRLGEIGWREEAEKIIASSSHPWDEFTTHPSVKQTKKLTQYGWNSIKSELLEMLSAHKTKRLAQERDKTAKQRYFLLEKEYNAVWLTTDLREPFPALGDIITNRIFEDLIWDTPDTEALTDVFFREKLSQYLPRIIEEWRPAKVQELVEVMQKSRPTASAADLHLATSVFECPDCRAKMQYPQIFYHFCCVYNPVPNSLSEERIKKIYSYDNKARMSHKVIFSESGSRIVKTIVESCSLDPATTTIQDLHSANPLIECPACYLAPMQSYSELGRSFMRWPYAVIHGGTNHNLTINSFGEETEQIIACEPEFRVAEAICCAHCHTALHSTFNSLLEHLKANHSDITGLDIVVTSSLRNLRAEFVQRHWYWNPRARLLMQGGAFRYNKEESALVAGTSAQS
ncbi:hypothetical protein BT96DRAFT_970203 [Gymnopus androsaceus JB14]|uniref:F-box domain-containing protein n=1 Tax=Gymnopus androsaceus JB14 TaxID=1447944 RepID=A0A6A4IJ61_9AGAR|nr:hypothetical protein BT96DRAFT_970203 [Gymnopus androsaceus JB14]